MSCTSCSSKSLTHDQISGNLICSSCGTVQSFDNFDPQTYGRDGPIGSYIQVGSSGTGSVLNYKDKKVYESKKLIDEYTYKLNLTGKKSTDVKNMIDKITEGEFGLGDWFPILIGACGYVVMRMENKSLPLGEIASVLNCDVYELGRMVNRVVEFLDLKLPEFDIVVMFERVFCNTKLPRLVELERDKLGQMRQQGVFLLNCAVKWFLTTGRKPMPLVAAVLVFVAELNGVSLRIEDVAKELYCVLGTCRKRYSELLEVLVKVAQVLPWGKYVNVKNIVKNAPFVMRYMELKSREKKTEDKEGPKCGGVDFDDVVRECLEKDFEYGIDEDKVESYSSYFDMDDRSGPMRRGVENGNKIELSHECLGMIYAKFLNEVDGRSLLRETEEVHGRKRRRGFELSGCREWWNGKSEMSQKLMLKKILEKDVGLDVMPPSFVNGCMENEKRRAKINSAKVRINKIMNPSSSDTGDNDNVASSECVLNGKRRKRKQIGEIDWEDFIIETLLLHQVKEEDIETGHYNTLLALHVFNCENM
ncbi:plant-specific TFIIB-related protein PTF2-like [Mangifera indica]|uniref:plant-specific TFIIB-related protein PTF2-like n=1 Tax=Mangifera indica TaxID=29780 RepID=UPI001CFAC159|nr:plant-specific TFIIB-related protein PTF2-like [Mangifera indica]